MTVGRFPPCGTDWRCRAPGEDDPAQQHDAFTRSMLFYCWASVEDGGPTLKQHWVNALCLMGVYWRVFFIHIYHHTVVLNDSCTRRDRCGSVVLSGCVYQSRPELANYQACVLTGHRVSESEMTMIFCLVTFLSKLL